MDQVTLYLDDEQGVGPCFEEVKRQVLLYYLFRCQGQVHRAAELMHLPAPTAYRMIRDLNLKPILDGIRHDVAQAEAKERAEFEAALTKHEGQLVALAQELGYTEGMVQGRLRRYKLKEQAAQLRNRRQSQRQQSADRRKAQATQRQQQKTDLNQWRPYAQK